MTKSLQWILGVAVLVIALAVAASLVLPFFSPAGAGYGMMGPGMMGGWGGMPFFGFGMFLWPLLPIGLVVAGAVWLVRGLSRPTPTATRACPSCGSALQAEWKACPHCGEKV